MSSRYAGVSIAVLCAASHLLHAQTLLNFESLNDGDVITTQFPGVGFSNAQTLTARFSLDYLDYPPHSGKNVITDNTGPITLTFPSAVSAFSGYFTHVNPITVSAFDSKNNQIATSSSSTNNTAVSGDGDPNELLSLNGTNIGANIAKVVITGNPAGNSIVADDLSYITVSPVAAFLDQNGAPALSFYGFADFPDAGGFLYGAPGVAQASSGDTYIVGLDTAGGVHLNSYSYANSAWSGWRYSGGILDNSSGLTAAVDPTGVVWFTGRDIGNRYWINSWNGAGFGGWILVADGIFAGDSVPQIAITSDGTVWIVGKDIGGRVWSNSYNPANQTFTGWVDRQAVIAGQPSVTAGQDGFVYLAVRGVLLNSPVYITRIPAQNAATANTWLNGGGLIDSDPQITSQVGTVYAMALAGNNTVYLQTFSEATQTYGAWSFTNGILNDATIAAAAGSIYIAGLDSADRIYWYSLAYNSWSLAGGAGISSTVLAGGK